MNDSKVDEALSRRYKVGLRRPEKDENYSINFLHWLKFDTWTLEQAASILEGTDPNKCQMRGLFDETFRENYQATLHLIEDAEGQSLIVVVASERYGEDKIKRGKVDPNIFVQWASKKAFEIPEPLMHLLDNRVVTTSPSSSSDDTADLKNAPKLLIIAIESWRRIWVEKEINNSPQHQIIIPWIEEKFRTSNREAKWIDQIIRPIDRKKGAVKKHL